MLKKLTWLGHAGFFYAGPPRVYIDPFRISAGPTADLVLLTHPHYDHCSPAALEPIVGPDTEILCPPDCLTALSRLPGLPANCRTRVRRWSCMAPGSKRCRRTRARAACTGVTTPGSATSCRLTELASTTPATRTTFPEMRGLQVDVACLPISGGETMTVVEAAAAANSIAPQVVVPMHYGTIGDDIDPELFGNLTRIEVHALERDPAFAGE